jgi:hypothetical protein
MSAPFRGLSLAVATPWHTLTLQDEAVDELLVRWGCADFAPALRKRVGQWESDENLMRTFGFYPAPSTYWMLVTYWLGDSIAIMPAIDALIVGYFLGRLERKDLPITYHADCDIGRKCGG